MEGWPKAGAAAVVNGWPNVDIKGCRNAKDPNVEMDGGLGGFILGLGWPEADLESWVAASSAAFRSKGTLAYASLALRIVTTSFWVLPRY